MDDSILYELRARICQVLADAKRLRLIDTLRDNAETSVGELAELIGASYYWLAYPQLTSACHIVTSVLRAQLADVSALSAGTSR